jgi:hypothetical protein
VTSDWIARNARDPAGSVPSQVRRGQAGFLEDLQWSVSVCRRQPMLALLSLLIGVAPALGRGSSSLSFHGSTVTARQQHPGVQALTSLVGLVAILLVGWPGTQRLWFLRAATGRGIVLREALPLTLRYFGRFVALQTVFLGLMLLVSLPLVITTLASFHVAPDGSASFAEPSGPSLALEYVAVVVLDVAFTFITPALVFTSHRVRDAMRVGLRLLRVTWPSAAGYVLVPPLAAVFLASYGGLRTSISVPLLVVSTMLNLVVKGATCAYYLRVMPSVGMDGALVLAPPRPTSTPETWRP